jgi:hypothetical protein
VRVIFFATTDRPLVRLRHFELSKVAKRPALHHGRRPTVEVGGTIKVKTKADKTPCPAIDREPKVFV